MDQFFQERFAQFGPDEDALSDRDPFLLHSVLSPILNLGLITPQGTTGLVPVDQVIARVNQRGWAHHIEQLMVMSNAMLLCDVHPDKVYRWFMELFIDSAEWVMVPNVYGMGQFKEPPHVYDGGYTEANET